MYDKKQFDELILEYLVVSGLHEQVEIFAQESGLNGSTAKVDVAEVRSRAEIIDCIISGDIEMALALLQEADPNFLIDCVQQHFELRSYQLVQHIANASNLSKGAVELAEPDISSLIGFVETHLVPLTTAYADNKELTSQLTQKLEDIMAVLMYPTVDFAGKVKGSSDGDRRLLAEEVNSLLLRRRGLPELSRLSRILQSLRWIKEERHSSRHAKTEMPVVPGDEAELPVFLPGQQHTIPRPYPLLAQSTLFGDLEGPMTATFENYNPRLRRERLHSTYDHPGRRLNLLNRRGGSGALGSDD